MPEGLCVYLLLSSGYFVLTVRHLLERLYQKICIIVCFPGAFATGALPVYLVLILVAKRMMPD